MGTKYDKLFSLWVMVRGIRVLGSCWDSSDVQLLWTCLGREEAPEI